MSYPVIDAITGSHILINGTLVAVADDQAGPFFEATDQPMFYEVIRVVEGVALFLEDHLARLERSLAGQLPFPQNLAQDVRQLIAANGLDDINLRLVLTPTDRVLHLAPSYYPDLSLFESGVATGILAWERPDPHIKVIDPAYKAAVADRFAQPGPLGPCFELLLADRQGFLTEGSRTNLFFIDQGKVVSAPDDRILLGITRKRVNQALAASGLELVTDLLTFEAVRKKPGVGAFLSGSPIDLVAIRSIEDLVLDSAQHPVFLQLNQAYQALVSAYIAARHP